LRNTIKEMRRNLTERQLGVASVLVAIGLCVCACGSGSGPGSSAGPKNTGGSPTTAHTSAPTASPTAAQLAAESDGAAPADTDSAGVEWLCRPGQADDPCTSNLTTTVLPRSGPTHVEHFTDASDPKIDCFYVYPTVSEQPGILANLHIDPAETAVAQAQASRFSQVCRVYAPMYPQLTLHAILDPGGITAADALKAYSGVANAWSDYLAHYNDGRGVVVIGHSQGAAMLIALLRRRVDNDPSARRLLVSAIIAGGNVTVPIGRDVGGSFENIPACRTSTQTGCVIAYSSFDQQPPANSLFGRPGQGVSSLSPGSGLPVSELQVLCVNPASLSGGSAPLDPFFPSVSIAAGLGAQSAGAPKVSTPWLTEPDLYSGQCLYRDGASWLQVSAPINPEDRRNIVRQTLGPTWGLHLVDINIALGNLVAVVADEAAAYTS
jgi:pimeloyl-ACP methyl ester carboxylesterase